MIYLGIESKNISSLIWNGLVVNLAAPVASDNYLRNRSIERNGEFSYIHFDRLSNGSTSEINLADCNFMVVAMGTLIEQSTYNEVSMHFHIPTYLDRCVQIIRPRSLVQIGINYTFAINFALDKEFIEEMYNQNSYQYVIIKILSTNYV